MENNAMERENIVELIDEGNNVVKFEHVMTIEYEGEKYALLSPIEQLDDVDEGELIILRIEEGEDQDAYIGVEDDDLLEAVFAKYLEIVEEEDE